MRKDFSSFVKELRAERGALIDALGLPEPKVWPEAQDDEVEPFEPDGWEPTFEQDELPDHPVFRMPQHRGWSLAVLGGVVSVAALIGLPVAFGPALAWAVLVGGPLLSVGLYHGGKRLRRVDTCSVCEAKLPDESEVCPSCEGLVVGRLEPGEAHLAALERLNVTTTHEGVLATPQEDAAVRYVKLGVKCPTCAWIPDGEAHWSCEHCSAEPFNTFAHGGECPECAHVFEETACPRCDHVAPYDWWWPSD